MTDVLKKRILVNDSSPPKRAEIVGSGRREALHARTTCSMKEQSST